MKRAAVKVDNAELRGLEQRVRAMADGAGAISVRECVHRALTSLQGQLTAEMPPRNLRIA